jgi:phosphatidylserine/phosphatidylglycerophosphate/cardiolipin synthase-like enzyme
MPFFIRSQQNAEAGIESIESLAKVNRGCAITPPKLIKKVPEFKINSQFIAYASPDSTYAVTKRLLDSAKKEIIIGIYDFTASYMKELLLHAMQRGVSVSLMLDIEGAGEQQLFDDLAKFGCKAVAAPSCASKFISCFPNSHEKVIVIDNEWCLVQSGNYSKASIPFNEKDGGDPANFVTGNRDMGVAILSKPLSAFFTTVLKSDMKIELDAEGIEALSRTSSNKLPDLLEFAPQALPLQLFPSKTLKPGKEINVMPILSPDNYMQVIPDLLLSAKKSIYIENQYIKSSQSEIAKLLKAISGAVANNPNLDVRIILGKLFDARAVEEEKKNIANLKETYGLLLGKNIRYIDTTRLVHCHNKMIVIDEATAVISSQNWSNPAVSRNREAGLVIEYPALAKYYTTIFESDWSTAQKKIPAVGPESVGPEALQKGNIIEVVAADYEEV